MCILAAGLNDLFLLLSFSTKQVSRFRTPFVEEKFKLLCQWREQLSIASQEAWVEFLSLFSEGFSRYLHAVNCIATLDCLFSLSVVAKQPGFVRYHKPLLFIE